MAKAERLVNLVALLLATRRPLTLDQITEVVPGYDAAGEALRRMFERDKDELRKLGVPIERGPVDPWGSEEGYFIDPTAYAMPDLELAPDERAALALAAQVWAGGTRAAQPLRAKLDLDPGVRPLQADLQGSSPVVTSILDALDARRRIVFTYRPPRREPARRQLDPYALVHRRGTWYVAGHDPDRGALRCFRLSRIESEVRPARPVARGPEFSVPPDFDAGSSVRIPTAGEPDEQRPVVVVRVAAPAARLAVLRGAELLDEPAGASLSGQEPVGQQGGGAGVGGAGRDRGAEHATIRLRLANPEMFLAWALANQAAVLEPADLAAELAGRRSALAARLAEAGSPVALPEPGETADAADARPGRRTPTAAGRVERLLALVPWVLAHPGASVTEVCAHFGIDRPTLLADLDLLFVSGLPPYGPGDLIEAWVEGDRIHIDLADYFARAPRLTWRETVGLYLAARALATVPGFDQHDALTRARKRLEASLPSDQLRRLLDVAARVQVDLEGDPVERQHLPMLTQAADTRTRVELEYYSSSRTEHTRRRVDPLALFPASGHWYLAGWCHRARAERLFRVDRMLSVTSTGEPFKIPAGFDPASRRRLPQSFTPTGVACAIAVDPDAEWVATVMPVQGTARLPDGRLVVRLAAKELSWAARLIVRLAPAAVPLDPPELREAVVRLLPAS